MNNFARLFCLKRSLPESAYASAALRESLHLPARVLYVPIRLFAPDFFAADLDLINGAGWLTRPEDMEFELDSYRRHPGNQSALRGRLGLSLSIRKIHRLVWHTLRENPQIPELPRMDPMSPEKPRAAALSSERAVEARPASADAGDPFASFPLRDTTRAKSD